MARKTVFNWRPGRLLRTQVPRTEQLSVLMIGLALVGLVVWVALQRNQYLPEERDLDPSLLSADGPKIAIYNQPLRPWVEPGSEATQSARQFELGPFPPTLVDADWSLAARIRSFDESNLYEKINGEAEKFIKQGFRRLHYVVLRGADGSEMALELYDQGNIGGSIGIFAAHRPANAQIVERVGVTFFATSVGLIGRTGQFFFRAAADRSSPLVKQKAAALVDTLSSLRNSTRDTQEDNADTAAASSQIRAPAEPARAPDASNASAGPAEMQLLMSALSIQESDITFEAANVFQFDFASNFWFGTIDQGARAFVHAAKSPEEASRLFANLVEEQQYDYQTVSQSPTQVVLHHDFLKSYFVIELHGRYLIGADGLKDAGQATSALAKLAQAKPTGGADQ